MNRLIRVEAALLHIPPTNVETSLRINDPDGGIDARIQAGTVESRWISSGLSVWQFKAGRTITAASILEEAQKPGVRKALADGGTYYLVVSADFIPTKINEIKSW